MRKGLIALLLVFVGFASFAANDCFPKKPKAENKLVYELQGVDVLSDREEGALDQKLQNFSRETSNQILILTVADLCGYDPAQYAFDIGEEWGIGQGKFDNGIVVLVKPTGGQGERETFIAVGYGLEPVIPDLTAKQISDHELIGNFKNGGFYKGLDEGTNVLMALAKGEFDHQTYSKKKEKGIPLFAILIILFAIGVGFLAPMMAAGKYARTNNVSFWVALMLMSQAGRSHRGGFGGFSSGSGGFGGGSSGGFGGFGGGSFGGGGAGGSW